jgi:hypothetical protein
MAISHKELIEQIARMKMLREAAPIQPGRAEDYAPLALDTNARGTSPILNNMVGRVGVSSDKASQFQSTMLENERNFQEYVAAQKQLQMAQQQLRRAEKLQALQAKYNGSNKPTRVRVGEGSTSRAPQNVVDQANGYKAIPSSSKKWKDPTPVNPYAGMKTINSPYGKVTVNATAADNFIGFLRALNRTGYKVTSIGGYANRNIAGTNTKSLHSYGLAIDINPAQNPVAYGKVITNLPKGVGRLAAKYGLAWGGQWNGSKKDPMHFSIPAFGTK